MCKKCHRHFCVNCRVPWHDNKTCQAYKLSNPYPCPEEAKLKSLATKHLWRQCAKCNHMVSLAEGCNHISSDVAISFSAFVELNGRIRRQHIAALSGSSG